MDRCSGMGLWGESLESLELELHHALKDRAVLRSPGIIYWEDVTSGWLSSDA